MIQRIIAHKIKVMELDDEYNSAQIKEKKLEGKPEPVCCLVKRNDGRTILVGGAAESGKTV